MTNDKDSLPPPLESSLLRVAQSCCEATKVLTKVPDSFTLIALGIVVSHGMEATLKCHLLQKGKSLNYCIKLGHNLLKTWDAAALGGTPIEGPPSNWLPFRYLPDMYEV